MKRLIINADDYGRSPDISRGIRSAHLRGVVTSTTCMMNIPTIASDIVLALNETPGLGMGVHLVLTMGEPISPRSETSSLIDENGSFFKYTPFFERLPKIDIAEVKLEWHAQVEAFVKASGRAPTHLDSHHHSSYFSRELFQAMLELAEEVDCPIRFPFTSEIWSELGETNKHAPGLLQQFAPRRPDYFISHFHDEGATHEKLMNIIGTLKDGTSEIMCHPGYVDDAFTNESTYSHQRERELGILTDPSIKATIRANEIELINFTSL